MTVGRYMEAIRDPHRLNAEECRYALNAATHLDFLIYQRISKKPVLAIRCMVFTTTNKAPRSMTVTA